MLTLFSLLVHDQLPEIVREDLKVHPGGIGRVLIKNRLETRREVLWYGREDIKNLPEPVASLTDGRFVSRTYKNNLSGESLYAYKREIFHSALSQIMAHH